MKSLPGIRGFAIAMLGLVFVSGLFAQPFNGGEITWECTSSGRYRFKLILYRECQAVNFLNHLILNTNVPGLDTFTVNRISVTDISPQCSCPGGPVLVCSSSSPLNSGALEMNVYTSDAVYPQGVQLPAAAPPPSGWYFALEDFCRPYSTNQNYTAGYVLRSVMFNYNNNLPDPCFDNAPVFNELPQTVACIGQPVTLNFGASDQELDSLTYEWAPGIMNLQGTAMPYLNSYSYNSPLPLPIHNPNNIPATLNPQTGMVSFTSFTPGAFWLVVKVTAYKCGIKVAEIYREIELVLLNCGNNTAPLIGVSLPSIPGLVPVFTDTVYAGQVVNFNLGVLDTDSCLSSSLPGMQMVYLQAYGNMFGSPVNPGGCINPPCATLTPSPGPSTPLSGLTVLQTNFSWQTVCQHLATNNGCLSTSNQYDFLLKTWDNFCPVPSRRYSTLQITVVERPPVPSPMPKNVDLLPGGDVRIKWIPVEDSLNSFLKYYIWYHIGGVAGPFTLLDSLSNISDSEYVHQNAYHHANFLSYFITAKSLCNQESSPSDTLHATSIGLAEENIAATFNLGTPSPNPTGEVTLIPFHLPQSGNVDITLCDLSGRIIHQESFTAPAGDNNFSLNLLPHPKGVYIFTLIFNRIKQQTAVTRM